MKRCAHCKEFKDEQEFAWNNRLLGTRQKHYRDCMKNFNRQSYERRSDEKRDEVKEEKKRKMREAQQFVWDYLLSSFEVPQPS